MKFKIWLGPPLDMDRGYMWPWWLLPLGEATPFASFNTTLRSSLSGSAGSASINLQNVGAPAGCWIGSEYVQYRASSGYNITGLKRAAPSSHSAGETVTFWHELTNNDGELVYDGSLDDNWAFASHSLSIGGVHYDPVFLTDGRFAVVQVDENLDGVDENLDGVYVNKFVGVISGIDVDDDYQMNARWHCKIVPAYEFFKHAQLSGVQSGEIDLAVFGSASAESTLIEISRERTSGDFQSAEADPSPNSAIDGNLNTLWCANTVTGTPDVPRADTWDQGINWRQRLVTAMYLMPEISTTFNIRYPRWIEITGLESTGSFNLYTGHGVQQYIKHAVTKDERLIVAENDMFEILYPDHQAENVVVVGSTFFDQIDLENDSIGIWIGNSWYSQWQSVVSWGNSFTAMREDPDEDHSWRFQGQKPPKPEYGMVMRYYFVDGVWRGNYENWAGYNAGQRGGPHNPIEYAPYFMLSLPLMELVLGEEMTVSSHNVGDWLAIMDAANLSTAGLADSGTIKIGNEQIAYSEKTDQRIRISARSFGGTHSENHRVGDAVYVIVDGDFATQGLPIESIGWTCHGSVHPAEFKAWGTYLNNPRGTGDEGFANDWFLIADVYGHGASSWSQATNGARLPHVMFTIQKCNVDPARPRFSEVHAILDKSFYGGNHSDVNSMGAVTGLLASKAGLPDGAMHIHGSTLTAASVYPAVDTFDNLIRDFADYGGLYVALGRDCRLYVYPDHILRATSWTAVREWTRSDIVRVEKSQTINRSVSQVVLAFELPDGSTGSVSYPETPLETGSPLEVVEKLVLSAEQALLLAERLFRKERLVNSWVVELARCDLDVTEGQIHKLDFQFGVRGKLESSYYLVVNASHRIKDLTGNTVLDLVQIS